MNGRDGRHGSPQLDFTPAPAWDVVDAQVHLLQDGSFGSGRAATVDGLLWAMDAVGIATAVVDEFWGPDDAGNPLPGHPHRGGGFRPTCPGAQRAALQHPDRIGIVLRIDHRDPDLDRVVESFAELPGARALRLDVRTPAAVADLADGRFAPAFAAVDRARLPVRVLSYGRAPLLAPHLLAHPDLTVVLDHCGLVGTEPPAAVGVPPPRAPQPPPPCSLDELLGLAGRHPNLAVKWTHAPRVFRDPTYPFPRSAAALRRVVTAFGADRVLWGSDVTAAAPGLHTWAQALFAVVHAPGLDDDERAAVLGGTARSVFGTG